MSLVLQPREVVVGDDGEVKARLLGRLKIAHQLPDWWLLAHRREPELRHGLLPDGLAYRRRSARTSLTATSGRAHPPVGRHQAPCRFGALASVEVSRQSAGCHGPLIAPISWR